MKWLGGRIHKNWRPGMVIGDLEAVAKDMVGKPVLAGDFVVGRIISAVVEGKYISWEAEELREKIHPVTGRYRVGTLCARCWHGIKYATCKNYQYGHYQTECEAFRDLDEYELVDGVLQKVER